jgi:hypothetical protein
VALRERALIVVAPSFVTVIAAARIASLRLR